MINRESIISWILGIIIVILIASVIAAVFDRLQRVETQDEKCKRFYGSQYQFIDGDRSPNLCVTVNGKVRYYDLIK